MRHFPTLPAITILLLLAGSGHVRALDDAAPAPAPADDARPADSAVAPASPPALAADDDTGWGEKHLGYAIHGRAEVRYVGRERAKVHDRDLYETLQLDLGTEGKDKVTGAFYARFAEDLDGGRRARGYQIFESVGDTYRSRLEALLYYGYLDIHDLKLKVAGTDVAKRVRVGRQQVYEVERAYFDGVKVET
ncbi:MAG: hypothetical protein HYY93_10080, partial [Planctomycetes bacterium]|nr:hypothetical protein [Planctomycetota bacterium]